MKSAATLVLSPRPDLARAKACSQRSSSSRRLGSPVSSSCKGIFVESLLGSAPGGDVLDLGEHDALSIKLTHPRQRDQGAQRPAVGVTQCHLGVQLTLAGLDQLEDAGLGPSRRQRARRGADR